MLKIYGLSKEEFYNLINAYVETLIRNRDNLYNLYTDRTHELSITFPLRPDEIPTMEVNFTKVVYENEKEIIEIEGDDGY